MNMVVFSGLVIVALGAGIRCSSVPDLDWARDSGWLLGGTVAFALATFCALSLVGGVRAAGLFMASTLALSWLAEGIGLQGGWLFGSAYRYHSGLQPLLPGGVPLFIPLAWFSLAGIPVWLQRGRMTTRADGRRAGIQVLIQAALCATGLMACDLALDPICVSVGLWTWAQPGPYFGVPWLNFAGWWAVAFLMYGVGYGLAGLARADESRIPLAFDLAWGATQIALLILMGVHAFSRIGSVGPVLVAMLAMVPVGVDWSHSLYGKIQASQGRQMAR